LEALDNNDQVINLNYQQVIGPDSVECAPNLMQLVHPLIASKSRIWSC